MRLAQSVLTHVTAVLALMFAVFLVLDLFNPMMNIVDNPISRCLLALLCAAGAGLSIWSRKEASR